MAKHCSGEGGEQLLERRVQTGYRGRFLLVLLLPAALLASPPSPPPAIARWSFSSACPGPPSLAPSASVTTPLGLQTGPWTGASLLELRPQEALDVSSSIASASIAMLTPPDLSLYKQGRK